jgi:hypothetical protein
MTGRVRVTITGYYTISEEDLREGGCYVDESHPGPVTLQQAVEIDRDQIRRGALARAGN